MTNLSTLLYAEDQILLLGWENALQKAFYTLHKNFNGNNLNMSTGKTKLIASCDKQPIMER